MLRLALVLAARPTDQERLTVAALAEEYRRRGIHVSVLRAPWPLLALRLFWNNTNVFDFHGARAAGNAWITRVFRRRATTICTLHERSDLIDMRFFDRALARASVHVAATSAHELIATQKTLQYALLKRYHKLPTYIPQGVSRTATARLPRTRIRTLVVVTEDARHAAAARRVARAAGFVFRNMTLIRRDEGTARAAQVRTRRNIPWSSPDRAAILRGASAILIPAPLHCPGDLRTIALAGRPLIVLDTPEHREALPAGTLFIPSALRENITEAFRKIRRCPAMWERRARSTARRTERLYAWDVRCRGVPQNVPPRRSRAGPCGFPPPAGQRRPFLKCSNSTLCTNFFRAERPMMWHARSAWWLETKSYAPICASRPLPTVAGKN